MSLESLASQVAVALAQHVAADVVQQVMDKLQPVFGSIDKRFKDFDARLKAIESHDPDHGADQQVTPVEVDTPKVKFAELTEDAIEACVNAPVVDKNGEQATLSDTDKTKTTRVLLAFAKSGMDIHDVDAVSKAVATYHAIKGSKNVQGLQVETLKALAKYCTWNGWTELGAKYTEAKKQDAADFRDARKELESGALPSRDAICAAIVDAKGSGTGLLRLYLQVVSAVRSDPAFLTTKPTTGYPYYDPETQILAGDVIVKTEGCGYNFSHTVSEPKVAAALKRILAQRLAEGHDFVFNNYTLEELKDTTLRKRVSSTWCTSISRAAKTVGFEDGGVAVIRRISTSENFAAQQAIAKRAHEMGHSVPVALTYYMTPQ
ncbi:hypothetical protein H9P43_008263 [Blastocladiella emersonii ATCC 22665]|nr:hypothetical protein H9P43_008263 [Blastocladiella emersonii ATCC 22665]